MRFRELKKHINSQQLASVYIATGDDPYVIKRAVDMFKARLSMPELNLSVFWQGSDTSTLLAELERLPVFDTFRLVIVEEAKFDTALLSSYIKNPNPQAILLFVQPILNESFSKILSSMTIIDCNRLDNQDLKMFIEITAKEAGAAFKLNAAELLIEYCGGYLARIESEVQKLAMYRLNGVVEIADVEALVEPETEFKIFELSDAVAKGNSARAADILKQFLDAKTPPVTLLGMLYAHFRRLLYCAITPKNVDIARLLGVKEYAVKRASVDAAKFSPIQLKKICDKLHAADYDFKSGFLTDKTALEITVMGILGA